MNLAQNLRETVEKHPNKTAYIWHDQSYSYGQVKSLVDRTANALAGLGVTKGDKVGILLPNIPDFPVAYYGVLNLGATVVPQNVMYQPREIAYMMNDSEAKAIITVAPFLPAVLAARPNMPGVKHIIVKIGQGASDTIDFDALINSADDRDPNVAIDSEDLAVICYTSGTTGNPKGAMLTHGNMTANVIQNYNQKRVEITPEDTSVMVLPLFHSFGMSCGMNMGAWVGGTVVLLERFDAEAVAQLIQKHHATVFLGAPPMFIALLNLPNIRDYDLTSLRSVFSGAASLPVKIMEMWRELTGADIMEGYGLTETSPTLTSNANGPVTKPGSVGPPVQDVEIRLVDDNDNDVPAGQAGELICRGPNVMKGYYKLPEATEEAFKGGWFHTGDIATKDEDGYYYIVDRKKEMINVSGFNVYPREVEEILYRHPKVMDAAVIAVPDAYQGESVMAVLVLKPDQTATEDEIKSFCRENLAAFKSPRHVQFREALPKLPTGKVLKREIREEILKDWPKS